MDLAMAIVNALLKVATAVWDAVQRGDAAVLDQQVRVRELLGAELATTLERRAAERAAELRFGRAEDDTKPIGTPR